MSTAMLDRYKRRVLWRKANAPVIYRQCGETFTCHPLVLEMIGRKPGDRMATIEECQALSASEAAHGLMRYCIYRAQMAALSGGCAL
jgi:hypothetical protein